MTPSFRAELFRAHIVFAIIATVIVFGAASCAKAETCVASWYGKESGPRTANGERFNPSAMTAAHRTRPFGSYVTVTNLANGRTASVRVNDRGPFVRGRCIDLSRAAAASIGISGTARVSVE
jgi:rare lipoprotein A